MSAKDWMDIIDHIFWWLVAIAVWAWMAGIFDKD